MTFVLCFLFGCCLGVGLYYFVQCHDKVYFKFKDFIEKSYGKENPLTKYITLSICTCLWIFVWVIYFGGIVLVVYILKPLL